MSSIKELFFKIFVDTKGAKEDTNELGENIENVGKQTKNTEKAAKNATGVFSSLGNAIKSLGVISLIAGAFNFFKEALSKNQKVVDTLAAVFGTLAQIVNELVSIFVKSTEEVGASTNGFEALGKTISGIITLALTPFKVAWYGIQLAIDKVRLAWEQSPFGKGDSKKITELTESINENKKALEEVAVEAIKAGKDIYDNFGEAVSSVVDVVSKTVDGASKMNIKAIYEQNKQLVELKNNAVIAAAVLEGVVSKYQAQAEVLRQQRDDETKSIEERIKKNAELGESIKKQMAAQIALAQQGVAAARAREIQEKGNIEVTAERIRAENQLAAIREQIAGMESEQLAQTNALRKEQLEQIKLIAESENNLYLSRKTAIAGFIRDEIQRLEAQRNIAKEASQIELKRLQDEINNYNEGTTARIQAEIAYAQKKQEIELQLASFEDQLALARTNRQMSKLEEIANDATLTFELRKSALDAEANLIDEQRKKGLISEEEYNKKTKKLSKDRIATQIAEKDAKAAIFQAQLDLAIGAAALAKTIFEKDKKVQIAALIVEQGAAIGKIISNLGAANLKAANASFLTAGQPWVGINTAMAALNIASVIANTAKGIKQIKSADANTGGGDKSGASVPTTASAPMQPQAPAAQVTQLNQESINALGNQAIKAYVIESDVTTNQQRIAAIKERSRFS